MQAMSINEIVQKIEGKILCEGCVPDLRYTKGFASDLMSDVLTIKSENLILITGLVNIQSIRTAEMSDITCIIFARNKVVNGEMIKLARENNITLISSPYSMFRVCGLLSQAGIQPVF
jgi:hypothetical protein